MGAKMKKVTKLHNADNRLLVHFSRQKSVADLAREKEEQQHRWGILILAFLLVGIPVAIYFFNDPAGLEIASVRLAGYALYFWLLATAFCFSLLLFFLGLTLVLPFRMILIWRHFRRLGGRVVISGRSLMLVFSVLGLLCLLTGWGALELPQWVLERRDVINGALGYDTVHTLISGVVRILTVVGCVVLFLLFLFYLQFVSMSWYLILFRCYSPSTLAGAGAANS